MSDLAVSRWRSTALILAALGAVYVVVQFYRVAISVIAPDMMRELALSPQAVGGLTGAFFLSFALAQIPVGMLLDRIGARITIPAMFTFAVIGSLLFSIATSMSGLTVARLLTGVGCAGAMGAMVVCARWFAPDQFGTLTGVLTALGNLGNLLATTPLAATAEAFGWRSAFVAVAFITAAVARSSSWWWFAIRRPGARQGPACRRAGPPCSPASSRSCSIRACPLCWRSISSATPSLIAVMGLWAGPYLHDVHGLGPVPRANVQLIMTLALVAALFAIGPLERYVDTRRGVVAWGAAATIVVLAVLAAWPAPPLWAVTVLFALLAPLNAYTIIAFAHGRAIFPDHLLGRGIAVLSLTIMGGIAVVQVASGFIVGAFTVDGVVAAAGYRWMFAFLAVLVLGFARLVPARRGRTAERGAARPNPAGSVEDRVGAGAGRTFDPPGRGRREMGGKDGHVCVGVALEEG